MTALREVLADFGVRFRDQELRRGNRRVDDGVRGLRRMDRAAARLTQGLGALGAAFASAQLVQGIGRLVSSTVESTNELGRWSQRLGVSITDLQVWSRPGRVWGHRWRTSPMPSKRSSSRRATR